MNTHQISTPLHLYTADGMTIGDPYEELNRPGAVAQNAKVSPQTPGVGDAEIKEFEARQLSDALRRIGFLNNQ